MWGNAKCFVCGVECCVCSFGDTHAPTLKGHRLPTFDYTDCWVTTLSKYLNENIPIQLAKIKKGDGRGGWITGVRPTRDVLYKSDLIERMSGISKAKAILLREVGVNTVQDFCRSYTDFPFRGRILAVKGIGKKGLQKWQRQANSAQDGEYVSNYVDHRKHDNPYLSRYGEDGWERAIATDIRKQQKVVCIMELVEHMYKTTKEFFRGTEFEDGDDFYFYHDALTQLSDKKTKQAMEEKGWLKHWLLPVNGCCAGTVYFGRPVGNTPEVMPWDESLNRDVHCRVNNYEVLCRWIKQQEHPELWRKRFTRTNQKQMLYSYLRVLDPETGVCPSSARIVQSINKCWGENIDAIVAWGGTLVPNLGHRNGVRAGGTGVSKRGGKRVKKKWRGSREMHPHAQEIWEEFRKRSSSKHNPNPNP